VRKLEAAKVECEAAAYALRGCMELIMFADISALHQRWLTDSWHCITTCVRPDSNCRRASVGRMVVPTTNCCNNSGHTTDRYVYTVQLWHSRPFV